MPTIADISAIADLEARIEALLQEMTLEEKVSLLGGATYWTTSRIERLGIPAIKMSDGPNGARGATRAGSVRAIPSACFPVGISLAATWNTALIEQVGEALARETQQKGAHILLAPTVNIHRSPLNGRNFECYSEDPYLSARLAVAYITGLQRKNIGATIKHFACNDSEFQRNSISSDVDERTLREIYLPPFQAAVQEAKCWTVMTGYNRVNGVYAAEHRPFLIDLLKQEWGFDGIVVSDWYGTKSTVAAANNGLDLEMPGPPAFRAQHLLAAVEAGAVDPAAIDDSARRLLRIAMRSGAFEHPEERPEQGIDLPEHRALIRAAGAEGIVLLKNEGNILPLNADQLSSLAIIGPNAKTAQIMGGGSSTVNAHYAITPYDGIAAAVGDGVQLGYELGCTNYKLLPVFDYRRMRGTGDAAKYPFTFTFFNSLDLSGDPVYQTTVDRAEQRWFGDVAPGVQRGHFSVRLTCSFTPQESGVHHFGLASAGLSRFFIDNREVIDNWAQQAPGETYYGAGSTEVTALVELIAGQTYALRVDYSSQNSSLLAGFRLNYLPPQNEDSIARAVALAARSDVALLFVGLNGEWESEGSDRLHMDLVGDQVALIEQVAAVNPNTVVVLQTGSPVGMPWLDKVAGVIQAWYPGQECGNAIADLLFGAVNPSGKLPQTFPRRLEDNPAYINYPGENDHVRYGEGIFVGYRYYEQKQVAPLFPFGFGLSYTSFAYGNLRLSADTIAAHERLTVSVDVTNTGSRAGQEIVQVYVRDIAAQVARPPKELKGFAKVALAPGETQTVTLTLDREALAYWDDRTHAWVAEAGAFEVLIGSSSQDIRARAAFRLTDAARFGGPPPQQRVLGIHSTLRELMADAAAWAVVGWYMPELTENALGGGMIAGMALAQVARLGLEQPPEEQLRAIARDLQTLYGAADQASHAKERNHAGGINNQSHTPTSSQGSNAPRPVEQP